MSDTSTGPDERTRVEPETQDPAADSLELLRTGIGVGERLGRFIVLSKLGEGGMALVYTAYDAELDRKVALKVLRGDSYGEHQTIGQARMLREAQALARLSHPNIVQIYDVGKIGKGVFIAMEFVQGLDLRAWLRAASREWREVLAVYLQAGEGLVAAHAAGLVHRDFKPDNVLLGQDGRVRVLDFGLARPHGAAPPSDLELESALRAVESDIRRGSPELTRTGAYLGTPAYMAPEQQMLLTGDARSDQFAFCVSLFEGLFGVRPFGGATPGELRRNIALGHMAPPPRNPSVPEWLRGVVLRGLSTDPNQRYPTMSALLVALRSDPSGRRRRVAAFGLAALACGAAAWGAARTDRGAASCDHVVGRLADVWDDARSARVADAFAATKIPYAAESFHRVKQRLDGFADAWTEQATVACQTSLREVTGPALSATDEFAELCLERRRAELRALVDVLARADATTVENANAALGRLQDPRRCNDPRALAAELARAPLPSDRSLAAAVWALRERIEMVRFLEYAGRYDEGLAHLETLITDARALHHPPALAEALLARASLLGKQAKYPAADAALLAALAEAERIGYDALRAEALVYRIELVGFLAARAEVVDDWIETTRALVHRVAPDSALEGRLLNNIGLMRYRQADFGAALASQELAVELLSRVLSEGDPEFIRALHGLGRTFTANGRSDEARGVLERARDLTVRHLGPEHPLLIGIYLNLANIVMDQSEALYRRVIELSERAFGPEHPGGAAAIANLGNIYANRGDPSSAIVLYRRAVGIYRRTLGVHTSTAFNLANVAEAAAMLGNYDEELAALREGLGIFERVYPEGDHPDMLATLLLLSTATRRAGQFAEARDHLERARKLAASSHDPSPPFLKIDLALADIDFAEAQTLVSTNRRLLPRARALVAAAAARLASAGQPESNAKLSELNTWLAAHPSRR